MTGEHLGYGPLASVLSDGGGLMPKVLGVGELTDQGGGGKAEFAFDGLRGAAFLLVGLEHAGLPGVDTAVVDEGGGSGRRHQKGDAAQGQVVDIGRCFGMAPTGASFARDVRGNVGMWVSLSSPKEASPSDFSIRQRSTHWS